MKILVTGTAGFIGFHTFLALRAAGHDVLGIDNLNSYNDVRLKLARLRLSGFDVDEILLDQVIESKQGGRFAKFDLADRDELQKIFANEKFDAVCHLAAQPGVRYSLENPYAYIDSNIVAFLNVLECCRHYEVPHLVYASSSSVYGNTKRVPFSVDDPVNEPISLYAATKKSDELMAYCYGHLYRFATTGLRFFTVYGPWGRVDMAMFKFTKAILEGKPIDVYNHGNLSRDFTYIDDIVEGVRRIITKPPEKPEYRLYNIGHGSPVQLMDFIRAIEKVTGKKAILNMKEMQKGDVVTTWADTTALERDYGYCPKVGIEEGVEQFVKWYREFYSC
jgi:UDP-glucuronate 4-epimerase